MKWSQVLFVYWCTSMLTVISCIRDNRLFCVSDYHQNISCVVNISGNPVGQFNAAYNLKFTKETIYICQLELMNHSYGCNCKVLPSSETMTSQDQFDIHLCNGSDCYFLESSFMPALNIQLTPPHKPEVVRTPDSLNITWESGYEDNRYISNCIDYELLLQKPQSLENRTLSLFVKTTSKSIPLLQLNGYPKYCIKVRSNVMPPYIGTWSKWSPQECIEIDVTEEQANNLLVRLIRYLCPLLLIVGFLLLVLYSPAARMKIKKIKTLAHAPSPAPFFQPLYQQHKGNLQEWLSPQRKFSPTYKTEEILISSTVTVIPKPITKDPEENQDFHSPPVTQLTPSQCPSSYVGLPGMHEPSQQVTMVCPKDSSYTQLPCSVWSFALVEQVEVQVVSSSRQNILELSHDDSGCSCEDLTQSQEEMTQSPECSLPNSPIADSPTPSYTSDYCILNKTAEGVVPVLVSK